MSEISKLMSDSAEEKQARMNRAKNDLKGKLNDKRGRPMGYIFPSKIKSAVLGEQSSISIFMNDNEPESEEKIAAKLDKEERAKVFAEARVPLFCPQCKSAMNAKIDTKFYWIRKKCHKCVADDETKMRIDGTFSDYEKLILLRNKIAFYMSSRDEILEFMSNLKNYQEFVNHDGSIERWSTNDVDETKNFLTKELISLDTLMEECISELDTLSTKFEETDIKII
jgi:hypothetical protein